MNHKFYATGETAISAMFNAVQEAKESIYWETFIFRNDTFPAYNFFELFKKKAGAGVKVILVLDGFAGYWYEFSRELEQELKEAGVEILFFRHWFRRIHRKILIVDEKRAFIGGVNVAAKYLKWLDLNVELRGRHIVETLIRSFARSYKHCGGTSKRLLAMRENAPLIKPLRKTKLWLLEHWPAANKLFLRDQYKAKIASARQELVLVTPYFIPRTWLVLALREARARGVAIHIILPRATDTPFMTFANRVFVKLLNEPGFTFYFTKQMIHAKVMIIDNREGMVGSINLDPMSFDWNIEAGVFFERKDMLRDLEKIVAAWKEDAQIYDKDASPLRWYHKPFEWLIHLISPVL